MGEKFISPIIMERLRIYASTRSMSSSPDLLRVNNLAVDISTLSPTPRLLSLLRGINDIPPSFIKKHTLLPYCEATTSVRSTAAISSSVKLRESLSCHLPAYWRIFEKIFIFSIPILIHNRGSLVFSCGVNC